MPRTIIVTIQPTIPAAMIDPKTMANIIECVKVCFGLSRCDSSYVNIGEADGATARAGSETRTILGSIVDDIIGVADARVAMQRLVVILNGRRMLIVLKGLILDK